MIRLIFISLYTCKILLFIFIDKELAFEEKVFVEQVDIYETYNPGAVVRICCCDVSPEEITPTGTAARSVLDHAYPCNKVESNLNPIFSFDRSKLCFVHLTCGTGHRWWLLWKGGAEQAKATARAFSPPIVAPPFPTKYSSCTLYISIWHLALGNCCLRFIELLRLRT